MKDYLTLPPARRGMSIAKINKFIEPVRKVVTNPKFDNGESLMLDGYFIKIYKHKRKWYCEDKFYISEPFRTKRDARMDRKGRLGMSGFARSIKPVLPLSEKQYLKNRKKRKKNENSKRANSRT